MTLNTENLIEVINLSLERGERLLVHNLNFKLLIGEGLVLRGANGSGKTTLLRAIAGFVAPLSGNIKINKDEIAYLGHLDAIKANETIGNQLKFWADLYNSPKDLIKEIANLVGIEHLLILDGANLSAGQKRRVSIARILLSQRKIWLFDEPAAPLDINGRKMLGDIFNNHRKNGGVIIAAVHDTPDGDKMQELWLDRDKANV